MDKKRAQAKFDDGQNTVQLSVSLFLWEEEGISFVYCPALDLTGYGNSAEEAKKSFETIIEEYIRYTHTKKTIFEDLEKLGWATNKRTRRVVSPDFENLLSENDQFKELYLSKNFKKESSNLNLSLV